MATRSASARSRSGSSTSGNTGPEGGEHRPWGPGSRASFAQGAKPGQDPRSLAMAESRAMARDPRIERGMLAQLTERRRRIDAGEASLGWKLGMGVPAAMAKLGTDAPLVGYLLAPARVADGGTVSIDGWGNARLEPEIAVHLGADL